jgi:1,2-diacylglycerol 3-beta-galactosyltransferase
MKQEKKFSIIILTADMGFGHRSAANAIADGLRLTTNNLVGIEVINLLEDKRVLSILRSNQSDYDRIVRQTPELQRLGYQFSDSSATSGLYEAFLSIVFYPVLKELIEEKKPDFLLTTFNMYIAPIQTFLSVQKRNIPFFVVVTDLTKIHRTWLHPGVDLICVPTSEAYQEAQARGISQNQLLLSGIPVRPEIYYENREPAEIRKSLGWNEELTTALVVGSKRIKNLEKILDALNHTGWPIQWILVAGKDEKLADWYKKQEWHNPAFVYTFVENMAPFLHASDLIITKAGGLIVSEALASGLPLFIVDITPGQEEGNAEYIVNHGAGELATSPLKAIETLTHWMENNQKKMRQYAQIARQLGRPEAAFEIAIKIMNTLEIGIDHYPINRKSLSPRIKQFFEEMGNWGELEESGKIKPE